MGTIDNEYDSEENDEITSTKNLKGPRSSRIVDSDDDILENVDVTVGSKSFNEKQDVHDSSSSEDCHSSNLKKKSLIKKRHISDSESDAEVDNYNKGSDDNRDNVWEIKLTKEKSEVIDEPGACIKNKFLDSDIYDAEGSSDEGQLKISDREEDFVDVSKKKKKEKKEKAKRSNLQRKSKQTAIEEIRSETQRLVRESRISLPYHRPKQRSLSEFLDRRKSLPVVPLKTSTDELSKVWAKIEEREKTAESFYKSESDASDVESSCVSQVKLTDETMCKSATENGIPLIKLTDDAIKISTTENEKLMEESSLELCLHYTETESQEILNKTSQDIHKVIQNDSVIKDKLNHDTEEVGITPIVIVESEKISYNESILVKKNEDVVFEISNQSEIKKPEIYNILASSSKEENFDCNSILSNKDLWTDSEMSVNEEFSEISYTLKNENEKTLNRSSRLKPDVKLSRVPKLSGQPDEIIDLEKSPEKPGAVKLISRFMKHITLKPKIKVQENVVVAISEVNENGEIVNIKEEKLEIKRKEESLKLKVGDTSKPGETRMKLKATLRNKIAQCREQQFAKRLEEYKLNEEEIFGEGEKLDYEEEAEELTASESESESEMEDDVIIEDKVKESNPFVDEEAEESENDEEAIDNHEGSDADEYSDAASVDLASLVDKDEDLPPLDADVSGSQRNDDLMALCSGGFPSQPINLNDLEQNDTSFTQFDSNAKDKDTSFSPTQISGKQDSSPYNISKDVDETVADEGESDDEITNKKKKKVKLTFSDDEDDVDGDINEEDHENQIDNDESENSKKEEMEDFGSDNEEIVLSGEDEEDAAEFVEDEEEAEYAKVTSKVAKRFLEAEAELSGSEWGSADEDELDLDVMEKEEGDEDVINQRKVRSELEKIHMKELLDEDKREIRALQELFLEDGELHSDGPKRQRQFRWYNQDGDNENGSFLANFDGEYIDNGEEEEDESWRKTRLERENFLRNQKNDDTEISDENLKLLKFAKKTVMKPSPKPPQANFTSPDPRKQFSLVSRRGSFLSRGEKLLSKLAELTNVSSDNPLGNVRGQRNMVFAVVSPPKEEPKEMPLKRKSTSSYPVSATKKLKFSPPRNNRPGASLFEKLKMVD